MEISSTDSGLVLCVAECKKQSRQPPRSDHAPELTLSCKPVLLGTAYRLKHRAQIGFKVFATSLSDGQYGTNGTVYQASISVNIAMQHDTRSDGQDKLGFQSHHHVTVFAMCAMQALL